ncbi:unnamed protein product [Ambrosiozyma monospora]|uniref:Unnamed protein product n=1 Tax=Ambrosiozyma monospora TaxID=43982 RepID=A0A9W6Z1I6_AMBMO|nr:unnamed protein product [Ambrosiozyma monospora]
MQRQTNESTIIKMTMLSTSWMTTTPYSDFKYIVQDLPHELKLLVWNNVLTSHVDIRDLITIVGYNDANLNYLIGETLKVNPLTLNESKTYGVYYKFGYIEGSLPVKSVKVQHLKNFLEQQQLKLTCDMGSTFFHYPDEYANVIEEFKTLEPYFNLKLEDLIYWNGGLQQIKDLGWASRVSKLFLDLTIMSVEEIELLREFEALEEIGIMTDNASSPQMFALKDSVDNLSLLNNIRFVESPSSNSGDLIGMCTKQWINKSDNLKITCEMFTSQSEDEDSFDESESNV